MIRNPDGTERLYLSKGDQTIYIDNCKIPQHHIDGIRFLFRQYKKKKAGVIINDTSGYGRNVQIVLFLKAVRHLFDKPVLVLCNEGTEHDWVEQFQTWTDLCDDVVLETEKPFIKKMVVINTMSNLGAFARRDWAVVVVDGDRASPQILKVPFKADYKIWVTPVNMKENLDKFSQVYKWLYPKETFDKSKFTPDNTDPLDVVDKAVLLDAFMEDIVVKNEEQDTSADLENNKREDTPIPMKISRKNKDATGTKIKRSKRKIFDDEDDAPLSKTKKDNATPANESKSTAVSNEDYENAMSTKYDRSDFTIDNFKRKSIEEFDEDLFGDKEESNHSNNQSEMNLYYEPDIVTEENSDRLYKMDTLVFGNDTSNDQSTNVNDIKCLQQNRESNNDLDLDKTPSEIDFDNINDTEMKVARNSPVNTTAENEIKYNNGTENNGNDKGVPAIFTMNEDRRLEFTQRSLSFDEMKSDINDIKSDIDELEASNELHLCNKNNAINENNFKGKLCEEKLNSDELTPDIDNNVISNEVQSKSNENEVVNESNCVTNEVPVTKPKRNCLEERMKELEEKALMKYKGSILDRLF